MTGLWVALGVVVVALVVGSIRKVTDGRARENKRADEQLTATELGQPLGGEATFVQFSTSICAPCRATHRLLSSIADKDPSVAHVEIDAEQRMDLVKRFGVTRTPTVLLLDRQGTVRYRFVGPSKRAELTGALTSVVPAEREHLSTHDAL